MKTLITVLTSDFTKAGAQFKPAGDRAPHGVDVILNTGERDAVIIPCKSFWNDGSTELLSFETFDALNASTVLHDLTVRSIPFVISKLDGNALVISVLALLDTHWMLRQSISDCKLHIEAPDGTKFALDFHNDGENLNAMFDGSDPRIDEYVELRSKLDEMCTEYRVLR